MTKIIIIRTKYYLHNLEPNITIFGAAVDYPIIAYNQVTMEYYLVGNTNLLSAKTLRLPCKGRVEVRLQFNTKVKKHCLCTYESRATYYLLYYAPIILLEWK